MIVKFEVETKEAGQRRAYGDSFYHYLVKSAQAEHTVQAYCTKVLRPSYPKDKMPNPFAGQMLMFKKITNNNQNFTDGNEETYEYKVKKEYTG